MNGFLVMSRHNFDDVPLKLFNKREHAERFIKRFNPDEIQKYAPINWCYDTELLSLVIIEFKDKKKSTWSLTRDVKEEIGQREAVSV